MFQDLNLIDIYHQTIENSNNDNLRAQLEKIGETITDVLQQSISNKVPTQQVANKIAEDKFTK